MLLPEPFPLSGGEKAEAITCFTAGNGFYPLSSIKEKTLCEFCGVGI